jgi:CelD/BcsL family acetyltransferase involved in cellulose biosynthesis
MSQQPQPRIEVIDDLSPLVGEWTDLLHATEAPSMFMTLPWVSAWRETLGKDVQLVIATSRRMEDGQLLGVAPFAIAKRVNARLLRYRALEFVGGGQAAADHLDLIIRTGYEDQAERLWDAVVAAGRWDVTALDGLRPNSHLARVITRQDGFRQQYLEQRDCPAVPLPSSWEEYEASLGKNLRRNLRRYGRAMEAEATSPIIERTVADPEEAVRTIEDLAELHTQLYAGRRSTSSFAAPPILEFHRAFSRRALEAGMLRMHRLEVGSSIAAIDYGCSYQRVFYNFQSGYDLRWARFGPGRRLTSFAIKAAIDEGAKCFDFLRGNEAYKSEWGAVAVHDDRIWMPASRLGRVVVPLRSAARSIRNRAMRVKE